MTTTPAPGTGLFTPANVHVGDPRGGWPAGTPLCPAEKGGEENNGACHLPRKNA